jgi:hypothetical protein
MNQEKVLKLFKNFVGGNINLSGLQCVPVGVGDFKIYDTSHIKFEIKNPNDVSYFYSIVEEELMDFVKEFSEFVSIKLTAHVSWGENQPKVYLNEKTKNKIQKVFDSVRKIEFTTGTPFIGYERYVINIESFGLKTGGFDGDTYEIENKVVPLSATLNGKNVDVRDAVEEYTDNYLRYKGTYYETEMYYLSVDSILNVEPLLTADWIATYYNTQFIL